MYCQDCMQTNTRGLGFSSASDLLTSRMSVHACRYRRQPRALLKEDFNYVPSSRGLALDETSMISGNSHSLLIVTILFSLDYPIFDFG